MSQNSGFSQFIGRIQNNIVLQELFLDMTWTLSETRLGRAKVDTELADHKYVTTRRHGLH